MDRVDEAYFREQIAPLLKEPDVQFIGEINEQEKTDFLGQALALMFLIDWPEPFGLSMIEAMACGTPVLVMLRGAVQEVVEEDLTGHIVDSIEEATVTLPRVVASNDYVRVYNSLLARTNVLVPNQADGLFGGNGRRDLGNKAGPALESYVAPQPSHGDYETIPDTN
jgi:glycosyltransferase involved in cell wall biosynthesis